jgi:hypothetical protein
VQAGEDDRALYLLTEGTVGVRLPRDEGAFKTIDAPSVLGELAFFDAQAALGDAGRGHGRRGRPARHRRRSTAARARTRARAAMLRDLARILALRLRMASDVIAELRGG